MRKINLVFVHGFVSGSEALRQLWNQLAHRPGISASVSPEFFSYESPGFELNPTRQIPALQSLGESLATFLETRPSTQRANPTVLVGHSQGGLVIQAMAAHYLRSGTAMRLSQIAHCVFIATPTNGSAFLLKTRGLLNLIFGTWNRQEKTLEPLDEFIGELHRTIAEGIVYAETASERSRPIPVTAIYGTEDAIVQPQSAKWIFRHTHAVSGDHFTVIEPTAPDASLCTIIDEVIERARGHLPSDASLIQTVAIQATDKALLQESLALHNSEFTPSQAVRKDDAEYWLSHYERQFGTRLHMIAGQVDRACRAFLMFHQDVQRNIAVVDYLVSLGKDDLDRVVTKKLEQRLRAILEESGVQYIVFEVARPQEGEGGKRDRARIRRFEQSGARVIPQLAYTAPSMAGSFDESGEEASLLMVASAGALLPTIAWSKVRELVEYIYKTWYRNWFSHREAENPERLESYLTRLADRVLSHAPSHGSVVLEKYRD
jgi:pimeloyl-ACP methyl ester carboxylesterase